MVSFRLGLATKRFIIACLRLELWISPVSDSSSNPFVKGRHVISPLGMATLASANCLICPQVCNQRGNSLGKPSKASRHPPLAFLCAYYHLLAFHFCQGNGGKTLSLNQKNHSTKINKKINWKINRIRPLWVPKKSIKKSKRGSLKNIDFFNRNDKNQYQ